MEQIVAVGRVRIEALEQRHQERFVEGVKQSQALHQGLVTPPATPAEYAAYLRRFGRGSHYGFAVVHQQDDRLVGSVALNEVVRGKFWNAYLGYQAFAPMHGKGLMREGIALVLDHGFSEIGLHRVEANIQPHNEASLALVGKLGFRKEGYSLGYLHIDGAWRDHERWAILADEWTAPGAGSSDSRENVAAVGER